MTYTAWSVVYGEQPSASKWNQLGANDAHFYNFLGDNTAWQSWTPSYTNLSGGTLNYAKYSQVGKVVSCRFSYTLGGAGVAGSVRVSVPVSAASDQYPSGGYNYLGRVELLDSGTNNYFGEVAFDTTTGSFLILVENVSGTYNSVGLLGSTNPFTWAANDKIVFNARYEAA